MRHPARPTTAAALILLAAATLPAQDNVFIMPPAAPAAPAGDSGSLVRDNLGTQVTGDTIVKFDRETNSIIIITDEETNNQIASIIQTLDQPKPQVLINVLFLEVTYNNDLDLGVEGSFFFDASGDKDSVSTDFGLANAQQGGFLRVLETDLTVTLRALAERGKLEVLSRPSVLTRNNETASITIGQEVPFIRNSRITDDGQTINTIEYDDIGIILQVTPNITPDRMVQMEVSPEISTLTAETVPISNTANAPVIAKRAATTRVIVNDGKTVVIGGLMEDNFTESIRKVPLLGDIPVLGALFRRTIRNKTKTELLIFLTPTVIGNAEQFDAVTEAERRALELAPKAFDGVNVDRYIVPLDPDKADAP